MNAILCSSDSVLLVVQPRTLSLKTLPDFLRLVSWIKKNDHPALTLEGVVLTMMMPNNEMDVKIKEEMKAFIPEDLFFNTIIPFNKLFEHASIRAVPIAMLRSKTKAYRPYIDLAMELRDKEYEKEGASNECTTGLF